MARKLSDGIITSEIVDLLNKLIDQEVESAEYGHTMFELGVQFGRIILSRVGSSDAKLSLACTVEDADVVRTNLTRLIEESNPDRILVVAPVLLRGATVSLESEFDSSISQKFEYLYFAEDTDKTDDGMVDPGIGGDVYQRLGFEGQVLKNRFTPEIVKERRYKHRH